MGDGLAVDMDGPDVDGLFALLRRLDRRLESAVAAMQLAAPDAAGDPYRGLYITHAEVGHLLGRPPGAPTLHPNGSPTVAPPMSVEPEPSAAESTPRLATLAADRGLDTFDLDVLVLALAPELDLRYERIFAFLQDDVTRRRPTVDLALNLLCTSPADRLARRTRFGPAAPLVRGGLLHLIGDPAQVEPPLLSHYLKLDDGAVRWLLGADARPGPATPAVAPAVGGGSGSDGASGGETGLERASAGRPVLASLARELAFPYGWDDLV